ncbi:MAG TPA: tRNA dihydrouridine synthase DusB [Candidatus Eubacterium faecale]|uniref:tRNA-dihydrouridine synthase n=1 Tax=Candidatus Eubacterium faecale TaxID=2838568 RepID=A0A9D2S979_9FIRM|nr:tRNA dihydrouridine synthase DusB [Candidatus Eubacterium faecale]
MKIRDIEFKDIAFLAPMAGVTDMAFRELCTLFGAAYTVTEMVSSKGLVMGDKKSAMLLTLGKEEKTAGAQIFGDDPDIMAKAAVKCLAFSPSIMDINMGCPAPKVAMNGGGASLMKEPQLAGRIVRAVRDAVDIPVTVKIRKGWDDSCVNAVELAKILEANGADAIAIHGRTRQQMYSGTVDLDIIRAVKKAVRIPVIGNGDITDIVSAANMLEYTGCDAVMIGRGAFGNPWLFRQINAYLDSGIVIPPPSLEEKMTVMLRHIAKMIEYKGEYTAMREARRHAAYYTKGLRGGAKFRAQMSSLETYDDLKEITFRIVKENQYDS